MCLVLIISLFILVLLSLIFGIVLVIWDNCLNLSSDDSADYDLSAVYTNIEVYINDLAGDFGDELESQCS